MIAKHWKFKLEQKNGEVILSIPDRGGMTDMVPSEPEQLKWLLETLSPIDGVQEIWPTAWKLDASAEKTVSELLAAEGASLT